MKRILLAAVLGVSAHGFSSTLPLFGKPSVRSCPSPISQRAVVEDGSEDLALLLQGEDEDLMAMADGEFDFDDETIALIQENGLLDPQKEDSDRSDVLDQFLAMMDDTPLGEMSDEEILLLRGILQELAEIPERVQQAEKTLFRILDEYDTAAMTRNKERMEILQPTSQDFELVAYARLESGDEDSNEKIIALFFEQDSFFRDTQQCVPSLEMVQAAMHALAESRTKDADRKAYDIVQRLPEYNLKTNVLIYESLIACLARSRQSGSAQRAEKLLIQALEEFPPVPDENGKNAGITTEGFNVVLTAWAKSGMEYGPERSEKLLVLMDEADKGQGILKPTASSFTSLIDAYAQMNSWDGACKAERTMNALLDFYLEEQDETLEPNIATWGIVLSCWNRVSKKGSVDAASKAANLLTRMETLYEDGKLSFPPDAIAYVTVMNAWCRCKEPSKEGAKHAEALLDEMNERYMDGDDSFKPSAKSVRAITEAWIKSDRQEGLFKAEEILEKYEDLDYLSNPDDEGIVKDIFKNLLFGWSQKEDPERAHEYLIDMVEQGMNPDCFCYDRVIEGYNAEEEKNLEKVKQVFELMEKESLAGNVKPNERVYTSFIRSLTKAKVPSLAQKAATILKRMNMLYENGNQGIKPTVFTYNAVLKACSDNLSEDSSSNLEAFKVALTNFNDLRASTSGQQPDHVTFGNMLKCAELLPAGPQREAIITTTFQLCCRSGFVNAYVVRDLQHVAPEELWRELCSCPQGDVNVERLPQGWVKKFEKKKPATTSFRGGGSSRRPSAPRRPRY